LVALVLVVLVALGGVAVATATSGKQFRGTVAAGKDVCAESVIRDTADNLAWTSTWNYTSCTSAVMSLSGHLGAAALGYRDGGYCGWTGWVYNSGSTPAFGKGDTLR
jgi:hypothetical protein